MAQRLIQEHNETLQLTILASRDVLNTAKEDCSQPVRLVSTGGTRLPAHLTSLGKALLSSLSPRELRRIYPRDRLVRRTPHSHTSFRSLKAELGQVRARGWAHDREEVEIGLECVGSVVCNASEQATAATSISVPCQRMSEARLLQLGEAVRGAAAEISALLGYRPSLGNTLKGGDVSPEPLYRN